MRTSSLPQGRRSSADRANLPPELNAYMKGKVPKGEVCLLPPITAAGTTDNAQHQCPRLPVIISTISDAHSYGPDPCSLAHDDERTCLSPSNLPCITTIPALLPFELCHEPQQLNIGAELHKYDETHGVHKSPHCHAAQRLPRAAVPHGQALRFTGEKGQYIVMLAEMTAMLDSLNALQPSTYLELLRLMGELRSAGEKGQRQLLISVLPRLAQMENLPTSLIPQLLQLLSTGSDRCDILLCS